MNEINIQIFKGQNSSGVLQVGLSAENWFRKCAQWSKIILSYSKRIAIRAYGHTSLPRNQFTSEIWREPLRYKLWWLWRKLVQNYCILFNPKLSKGLAANPLYANPVPFTNIAFLISQMRRTYNLKIGNQNDINQEHITTQCCISLQEETG